MNAQLVAFDTGLCRQVGHLLEGGEVFRPAIRVTRVVDRVDPDENIIAAQYLGPGQSQRQHDGVARRHIGDRNTRLDAIDRHVDGAVGQGRSAKLGQSQVEYPVLDSALGLDDPFGRLQLGTVTLTVVERKTVTVKALATGNGEASGGIESTGKENDGWLHHGARIYPKNDLL